MVDGNVRIRSGTYGVVHRNRGPIAERSVDHDRRRGSRDGNEQEACDQNREERRGRDCGVPHALRRNRETNLLSSRPDGSRPSNRPIDPPLFAHQPVHPPCGSDETVDPADAVHQAVRATEPVHEAVHATAAVDEAVDLPGPAGRCLGTGATDEPLDRKSTRLNSSHLVISYAVFCLKKKKKKSATSYRLFLSECRALSCAQFVSVDTSCTHVLR